ncbi:MAG TPA: response regulator [Thermoanaerobaculia bacterium]|nr:response regulator [Thermoanaerobaculia bacterium]
MQPKKILIVDDEDHIREIASVSLELTRGWEVSMAGSGADALRIAPQLRPDAILLDVMMPGMDGPTTFRRLQDDPSTRDIPVIFLTAKVQAADRRRFTELGVRSMIAKPFDPLRLAIDVAAALEWV